MAYLLKNLIVDRVSFVDRAAVRDPEDPAQPQRFLFWKSERGKPWHHQSKPRPQAPPTPLVKAEPADNLEERYRKALSTSPPTTTETRMEIPEHAVRAAAFVLAKAEREGPSYPGRALAVESMLDALTPAQLQEFERAGQVSGDLGQGAVREALLKAEVMVRGTTPVADVPVPVPIEKFDPLAPLGRDLFDQPVDLATFMQDDPEWMARERGYAQSVAEAQAETRQYLEKREQEREAARGMLVKAAEVKPKPAQDVTEMSRGGGAKNIDIMVRAAEDAANKAGKHDLAQGPQHELLRWFLSTDQGKLWLGGAIAKGDLQPLE